MADLLTRNDFTHQSVILKVKTNKINFSLGVAKGTLEIPVEDFLYLLGC